MRDLCLLVGVVAGCGWGFDPVPDHTCLEAQRNGRGTGKTIIDPDGEGSAPPHEVWCEQERGGGGWALALKIDGASSTFAGDKGVWSDMDLFQPGNLDPDDPGEAKLAPYIDYPVAEVMLVTGDDREIVLPLRAKSLHAALTSELTIPTSVAEDKWTTAFDTAPLQSGCRRQGFGILREEGLAVRIGLVASQAPAQCRSPATFIGVGNNIPCPNGPMLAAGAISVLGDGSVRCTPARVLVFVRDDDRTYYPSLPSCKAHLEARHRDNGIYHVGDPAVPRRCDMTTAGGGWTNALDFDSLRDDCPKEWQQTAVRSPLCVSTKTYSASHTIEAPLASYREVMVSVSAFQLGSTDGFHQRNTPPPLTINDEYLDGLSITTAAPRRHIASYAVGLRDFGLKERPGLLCPCRDGFDAPSFVTAGTPSMTWRCESGAAEMTDRDKLHLLDPLFDAAEVPVECAAEASADPILTALGEDTSAGLEARLMTDEPETNEPGNEQEGLAVHRLELWVR